MNRKGGRWERVAVSLRLSTETGKITFSLGGDDLETIKLEPGEIWHCSATGEGRHTFPGTQVASNSPSLARLEHRVDPVTQPTVSADSGT
jgi:hypothetical protein